MAGTLNTSAGSVVAQAGQQIDVASLLDITAGGQPNYLVVSLLDRNEYTAASTGNTGTLSGNGNSVGFSNIGGDSDTVGIVFAYNASTGQYTNATYGNLAGLIYTASTDTNDNASISFFTSNNATLVNQFANDPIALESFAPGQMTYVGSVAVVTQPSFVGPAPSHATPDSIATAAMSFVGKACNMDGCWVLASNISAEGGASLPITSTSLGIPGVANGEWIVAYNGPAGQSGNWQSLITAGEMVVFETSATSGHITTVVSGSGSSAMLVDNITYVHQNGQIANAANDGSANDIIIASPHAASQEWAMAVTGSVVIYELDCPVVTVTTAVSTQAAGKVAALAPLFSASNPLAGQAITAYQFYDVGTGGAAGDSFMVGGTDEVGHSAANAITVSASALSTVNLQAASASGTDSVAVRAFNGSYWGDWVSMTVDITGSSNAQSSPVTPNPSATPTGILESLTPAQEITAIYLGYFDRAPDPGGFAFWEDQYALALSQGHLTDTAVKNIANSFTPQLETVAQYPFLATQPLSPNLPADVIGVDNLVVNIYMNLFDRAPATSDSGVQYWAQQILSGQVPLGQAILFIANGATGSDAGVIMDKIVVGDFFAAQTTAANIGTSALSSAWLTDAHAVLMGVTYDPLTVTAAENTIDALIAGKASVVTGTVIGETLTGGNAGGDILYPVGGADTINLGSSGHSTETVYWGATYNASSQQVLEPITNSAGISQQGFWGNAVGNSGAANSTSADMSMMANFTPGATGDILAFVTTAWGSGGANGAGVELGLVQGDGTTPAQAGAVLGAVQAAGVTVSATANVILDGITTYANARALASALASAAGHVQFASGGLVAGDSAHMLFAYATGTAVNVADVEFINASTSSQSDTARLTVLASDLVQLTGVSLASLSAHNIALFA
jgi:hypothetical protein